MPDDEKAKAPPYPCITTRDGTVGTRHNDQRKQVRIENMSVGQTAYVVARAALRAQQFSVPRRCRDVPDNPTTIASDTSDQHHPKGGGTNTGTRSFLTAHTTSC